MNTQKWIAEDINYFVALYRNHECLWNQLHSDQKQKRAAYTDIQEKMFKQRNIKMKIVEIKEKIVTLRELYVDLKKKYKCPPIEANRSKWYADMEYVMTTHSNKLFDKTSGESLEKKTADVNIPINQPECKTTTSEEVSMSSSDIESKLNEDNPHIKSINLSLRIKIFETLKHLYLDKVAPDYLILADAVNKILNIYSDPTTIDFAKLFNIINLLGFIKKETIAGETILVEEATQRFERYTYFTKIKTARMIQNRRLVYIDERIIDSEFGFEKVYSLKDGLPEKSMIFYHAFTREGLLNGIFSNQATEEEFTKWVSSILMSYLKTPCLIIMDRGPLHGVLEEVNPITRYSPKSEMSKWLIDNNIPFSGDMQRPVLFELIRKNKKIDKEYKIDKIFKSHGHKVLHLPHTFPDLNLSHFIWAAVSENIPSLKTSMLNINQQIVQEKIRETVQSVSKNKALEKLLVMKENEINQIDVAIESLLENYVFKNK